VFGFEVIKERATVVSQEVCPRGSMVAFPEENTLARKEGRRL